jgi:hypothetical protein
MTSIQDYIAKTVQLQRQQAGLELVTHIRTVIESEHYRRVFKGDHSDTFELHIKRDGPILRRYEGLRMTLLNTELWQQKQLLDGLLLPYVEAGDIPEYSLREVKSTDDDNIWHLVIDCEFPK